MYGCTVEEKKENALQTTAFIHFPCSLFKKTEKVSEQQQLKEGSHWVSKGYLVRTYCCGIR